MSKLLGLASTAAFLLLGLGERPQTEMFSKYRAVEAFEVLPGILAMPRYADDGQVCEIGVQRRIYSPEMIRLDADLSRQEIDQVVDDLVPSDERGPKTIGLANGNSTEFEGHGYSETVVYQNIVVQISGEFTTVPKQKYAVQHDLAATISWKNRKCP